MENETKKLLKKATIKTLSKNKYGTFFLACSRANRSQKKNITTKNKKTSKSILDLEI